MEEEKQNEKTEFEMQCDIKKETERLINCILEDGINSENVNFLGKVVDIHKDIENEKYWEEKIMRYRNYSENYSDDSYGRRMRDSHGRYMDGSYNDGSYGRRGVKGSGRGRGRGRYRGEDMLDEMAYHYSNYSDSMENYGADEETMKSFKYMLKSFKDYYKHLKNEASSQEEIQLLEETAREMLDM